MAKEIELKFTVVDDAAVEELVQADKIGASHLLSAISTSVQSDVYYDTPAYDLIRAGLALRIRTSDSQYRVTLKSPGTGEMRKTATEPLHTRLELEAQIEPAGKAPHVESWPSEILEAVEQHANPQALAPIARLVQTRQKRAVYSAAANVESPFAELSIDDVNIYNDAVPVATPGCTKPCLIDRFTEVEIELAPGEDPAALAKLSKVMRKKAGLKPAADSKLERALAALAAWTPAATDHGATPGSHLGISPGMTMAEACRLIWRQQLFQIMYCESGVRSGVDAEDVHDARVAIRRARVAGTLFGHFFKKRATEPFLATLRDYGRRLGHVRDLDVALASLSQFGNENGPAGDQGMDTLRKLWLEERADARRALLDWLDSPQYHSFVEEFAHFSATVGAGVKPQDKGDRDLVQVRHILPSLVQERFARVRWYAPLVETNVGDVPAEVLHSLRIECKFLRYVLEYALDHLGEEGTTVVRSLKKLQDVLGDLNDCEVEQRRLVQMAKEMSDNRAIKARQTYLRKRTKQLRKRIPKAYRQLVGLEQRRTLALALAWL